jgi:hypothetical protein
MVRGTSPQARAVPLLKPGSVDASFQESSILEFAMCRLPKLIGALVILAFASHTAAAEEVWSTSGFNAPESVVLDAARNVFYV